MQEKAPGSLDLHKTMEKIVNLFQFCFGNFLKFFNDTIPQHFI